MSSARNDIPDELKDAWGRLLAGGDARKLRDHLPALQDTLAQVRGVEASLKDDFGGVEPGAVVPARRAGARAALVSSLQSHSVSIGGVLQEFSQLSADAQGAVQKVLEWIARHLVDALTAFAKHLGVQSWSVAAGVSSTPPGASFTITLTFT